MSSPGSVVFIISNTLFIRAFLRITLLESDHKGKAFVLAPYCLIGYISELINSKKEW